MYIIYAELLIVYTQVMFHKMNNMQIIFMLIPSIIRVGLVKVCHEKFWFLMFHKSKIQEIITTGYRLIITKVLQIYKIIPNQVKGGYFNEIINFRQEVSHPIRVKIFHQASLLTGPIVYWGLVV